MANKRHRKFPFLFGGTFIEGFVGITEERFTIGFPFLFGGTFIEGSNLSPPGSTQDPYFPSFSEGLSLRDGV